MLFVPARSNPSEYRRRFHCLLLVLLCCLPLIVGAGCSDRDPVNPAGDGGDGGDTNQPPSITAVTTTDPLLRPNETAVLACTATDPEGDSLSYTWAADEGALVPDGATVVWTAPDGEADARIRVEASDGRGGVARDTVTIEVRRGTLLIQTRDGLQAADFRGAHTTLHNTTSSVEVLGSRIFIKGAHNVRELDHEGNVIGTTEISEDRVLGLDFVMHPDGGFTYLNNHTDSCYVMSSQGAVLRALVIPHASEDLQNINGVIAGNRIVASETGNNELFAIDLGTLEAGLFRTINDGQGWLGAIDYSDGTFFICRWNMVQSFVEGGDLTTVCTFTEGNITGIASAGSYLFVVMNHANALYRVDRRTGEFVKLSGDLNYPQDVEYLPAALAVTE